MNKLIKQILKFGVVGGIAFVIDYAILYILTEYFNVYYLLSSVISFTVSVIVNYLLSVKWVFDVKNEQGTKGFVIFIVLSIIGLGINSIIMYLMVDLAHIHYMLSKLVSTFIVMVYNFITKKIFMEK